MRDEERLDNLLNDAATAVENDSKRIQDFMLEMLRINATNPRMGGPGEVARARFVQNFLDSNGFDTERFDAEDPDSPGGVRPSILSKLRGTDSSRTLWYITHLDTVPEGSRELWLTDPFDPVVKDGKITARGAEDNGQALASAMFAMLELRKLEITPPINLGIAMVSDEEFGSNYGVKFLLRKGLFSARDLIIVPDSGSPDGSKIQLAEKGLLWLKVTTLGKQVHASRPSLGTNAHRAGIDAALKLDGALHKQFGTRNDLYDPEKSSTFELTKIEPNVGNINTIPGVHTFYMDCRVLPEYRLDDVILLVNSTLHELEATHGVRFSVDVISREDAGAATPRESEVSQIVTGAIVKVTKKEPRYIGIGGQTVGNIFRREGMQVAVWSTIENVAHQPNEYCLIKNLLSDTKVFASIPLLSPAT